MNKPSKIYWFIVVLGLLGSFGGAYDYWMTATENAEYMARIPADTLAYYESLPIWLMWPWAIAIWGTLLGWVFMLLKRKWAVPTFLVSLISLIVTMIYFGVSGGYPIMGAMGSVLLIVVLAIAMILVLLNGRGEHRAASFMRPS